MVLKAMKITVSMLIFTGSLISSQRNYICIIVCFSQKESSSNIQLLQPRLRSRPKWSYDQTFQTEVTSDQTFQTKMISDQTFQTTAQTIVRLWSDPSSDHCPDYKQTMIRQSSEHGPDWISDHCPDLNQTMIRLKCAQNSLIRERF